MIQYEITNVRIRQIGIELKSDLVNKKRKQLCNDILMTKYLFYIVDIKGESSSGLVIRFDLTTKVRSSSGLVVQVRPNVMKTLTVTPHPAPTKSPTLLQLQLVFYVPKSIYLFIQTLQRTCCVTDFNCYKHKNFFTILSLTFSKSDVLLLMISFL